MYIVSIFKIIKIRIVFNVKLSNFFFININVIEKKKKTRVGPKETSFIYLFFSKGI